MNERVFSKFARRDGVTFFPRPSELSESEHKPRGKMPSIGLAKRLKNPKFKRLVKAIMAIKLHGLWRAFMEARADGLSREDAAAKVVRIYQRGVE